MAIDSNKLAAFAGAEDKSSKSKKKVADDEDADLQEYGDGRYGALIPLLEEHAEDILACADEIDTEALEDPESNLSDEDADILIESLELLPEELQVEAKAALGGISAEDATALAAHLERDNIIDDSDADRFAGWLFRLGSLMDSDQDTEDDAEDDDTELDD